MKIGILFGASSFEHEISVVSAIALKKVLTAEIVYIFCDYDRNFYHIPTDKINSKRFSSGEYKKDKKLELKNGGFFQKTLMSEKKLDFDVTLNVIHGKDGEDGKIASLLDFFGVPYIGPRVEASAISYNKLFTKMYAKEFGVNTLDYKTLEKSSSRDIELEYPVIIKPTRLGSSIGISIVKSQKELDYALDVAFEFDTQVIIEPFIDGIKEYNLAGCKTDKYNFSIVEEPQKEEFLDFDKKYLDFSRTKRVNEAELSNEVVKKLQEAFIKLYEPLFAGALIRCDFFILNNEIYINEINPVPGSMANYLFDDFNTCILDLSKFLPTSVNVNKEYKYINSIQAAKGK
ncbi:D-alanine--D-alanine ligase [Sulfurospirillum arcachonense]|uniref:D-alanine--D-alanine ligase n=1 Tax=Sulfurospirillum arcachonense TaxID=57666 RepID=UPI0004689179|nr:D-alanine--D-alanine ligase [Sulfurospirillum arcachonense]